MKYELKYNFKEKNWGKGISCQLEIFPPNSKPESADFIWMTSITLDAEMDDETFLEGKSFSRFENYERILTILEGNIILAHGSESAERLGKHAQTRFDGATKTESFGKLAGYLLTFRKGIQAATNVLNLKDKYIKSFKVPYEYTNGTTMIYCDEGFAVICLGEEKIPISKGEQFILQYALQETGEIKLLGKGIFLISEITYDAIQIHDEKMNEGEVVEYQTNELKAATDVDILILEKNNRSKSKRLREEDISKKSPIKKGRINDYLFTLKISSFSRKNQGMLRKKEDNIVYSKRMKENIQRIRYTFIPFFVGIVTLGIVLALAHNLFGEKSYLVALLVWGVSFALIINPIIYYMFIPKPVYEHVRFKNSLNDDEVNEFTDRRLDENKFDKILKKYKDNKRNR